MAFQGFGKNSGPGAPVKLQNPFGSFPNAAAPSPPPFRPSPPFQPSISQSAPQRAPSPPLGFQNKHFFPDISPSSRQIHPVPQRGPSPPLDLQNKHSFPDLGPPARQIQSQSVSQRAPSPPLGFQNKHSFPDISSSSRQTLPVPQRAPSPPLDFQNKHSFPDIGPPARQLQRPVSSTSAWGSVSKLSSNFPNRPTQDNQPSDLGYIQSSDSGRNFPANHADVQAPKRVRSPSQPYMDESSGDDPLFDRHYLKRPSISPSRPSTKSNVHIDDPQSHQWFSQASHIIDNEAASKKPTSFPAPKRTRSPSPEPVFQGNSNVAQEENERELQAKAKRLARFKNELNEPMQSTSGSGNQKAPVKKHDQSEVEKRIFNEEPSDMAGDYPSSNISADYEGAESSTIIIGVCPDMCPESERGERERKGDLDQYERVDGDRNQTSISLAVKKYTRTAAREADLIRPMPILQKTLDYLLHLLDQPYDDTFLGSYNFLWDRMRAIRMDLRMQHIFNLGSITMLEQMIRLHIIAMHELCQYTKGEGFSEGFDAHLNIEQMNKTSVELFQLYDDHRKRGIDVPTEKEFRGYYALLKLDKHPGYKVEPAELSLDLAKMTPEIRQAAEVLFARNVARACRTGNFIAFFRLASEASYLQACLMHAHFGKLRSQALASLHTGLQSNQGIPVSQVAKWLGMEEENIEDLLDYHGFAIKDFEEPYMVKEGSFLNGDSEYPLKRSKLVDLKKSRRIVEDVSCPSVMEPSSAGGVKWIHVNKAFKQKQSPVQLKERESPAPAIDDEMAEYETADSSKKNIQMKPEFKAPVVDKWNSNSNEVGVPSPAPAIFSIAHGSFGTSKSRTDLSLFESPKSRDARISFESPKSSGAPISLNFHNPSESPKSSTGKFGKPIYDTSFRNSPEKNMQSNTHFTPQIMPTSIELERSPATSTMENQIHQSVIVEDLEAVEYTGMEAEVEPDEVDASHDDEEVGMAKLKLILRIWRRRSSKKKELREQKQLAANAALSSLSLGLPMRQYKEQQHAASDFNIDHVMSERYERHEQSWSRLNVSDVVAAILSERNQQARCLCWKVVFSSYSDHSEEDKLDPGQWLRSKIMPTRSSDDEDLIISSPGLSVWKKWFSDQSNSDLTCCFSVIKEPKSDKTLEAEKGASAILFLVSESISCGSHKIRLHNLLVSIPSGSQLPLLIMVGSYKNYLDPSVVSKELELDAVDNSKISSFLVIPLLEDQQMKHLYGFFSDEQLRKGLQWLASESPLQPPVCCIKTHELVQSHLNLSLEVLENLNANKISPDQCVSAFNGALDRSIENVINAAKENPISWPCPEIAVLEKSSYEYRIADLYLPQIGWSSPAMIEPLLRTLNDCKLPPFQDGTSWLDKGSDFGNGIENQRLRLEDLLVRYLTQSTHLMGLPLAQKEASIMLQTCAGLDLHHSTYYIVPKWAMIFQRIFNWRLMNLYSGPSSTAYVLEQNYTEMITSRGSSKLDTDGGKSSPYQFNLPSLDEMVDVSCGPYSEHEKFQLPSTQMISYKTDVTEHAKFQLPSTQVISYKTDMTEDERSIGEYDTLAETNSDLLTNGSRLNTSSELAAGLKATKEADRLSKLLEQCNIVQNMIDNKLSIYFP